MAFAFENETKRSCPMPSKLRLKLRSELESPPERRKFGSGYISGVMAMMFGIGGLLLALCLRFPTYLTVPQLRVLIDMPETKPALFLFLLVSYLLAVISLILRDTKVMSLCALSVLLVASVVAFLPGQASAAPQGRDIYFGVDWFAFNVLLTGLLFVPLERFMPRVPEQRLFRIEWREDLFYYFVSSMFVQFLTMLTLFPATVILHHTAWGQLRAAVASQPAVLQFFEIMFLTDLFQYGIHRLFHQIPALWRFHAVHHSAQAMDWMASARMHVIEIVALRGFTVIPMQVLGFGLAPMQAYILAVYISSTFIHANVHWSPRWLSWLIVTPRFHHWHHGSEREAIDVNFAVHFSILDKVFGTYHMPEDRWPKGYGVVSDPVPNGYWRQFCYPSRRSRS
jgi:sterol desaturase/sphingolipid hydroxylase (fatty acid hydroxylase superfamily)